MNGAEDNTAASASASTSFYPGQQWAWPQQCHAPECQRRIHEAAVENAALRSKVKHLEDTVRQMSTASSGWLPSSWVPSEVSAVWGSQSFQPVNAPSSAPEEPTASTSADSASSRPRQSRSSSSSSTAPWPRVRDLVRRLLVAHLGEDLFRYSISGQRRDHVSRPVPARVMASVTEVACEEFAVFRLCAADVKAQVRVVLQNCYQNFLTRERRGRASLQQQRLQQELSQQQPTANSGSSNNNNGTNGTNVDAVSLGDLNNLDYSPRLVIDDGEQYSYNPNEELMV